MIDIQTEQLLTLNEATALLPGRPSVATLWRWRHKGVGGRKLDTVKVGGRVYTTRDALARFACVEGTDVAPVRSPVARNQAISQAERELAEQGI